MAVSVKDARRSAGARVWITLTPADVNVIARAIRSELESALDAACAAPLPGREDIARIRRILDVYERQLEELEWGEPEADIVIDARRLSSTPSRPICAMALRTGKNTHRVAVCAIVQHLLAQVRGRLQR